MLKEATDDSDEDGLVKTINFRVIGVFGGVGILDQSGDGVTNREDDKNCTVELKSKYKKNFRSDFESLVNISGWSSAAQELIFKLTKGSPASGEIISNDLGIEFANVFLNRAYAYHEMLTEELREECD